MASRSETEVEPLSNYLVGRAQREITERGALGLLATAVNRDLSAAGAARRASRAGLRRRRRRALLPRSANVTG